MKNYKINTEHTIYVDSYTEGEQEYVNGYSLSEVIKADTVREAIEKYFYSVLCLPFTFEDAYIDDENTEVLHYSSLVDEENNKPTDRDIENWKEGDKTLYNNNIFLTVQELVSVNLV